MLSIKRVMKTNVISVNPEMPIFDALNLLVQHKISGMPVVNEQMEVIGILTEKDVLKLLIDINLDIKKTVDDYMTRDVVCFKEEDSAIDVCKFFITRPYRRVPIVRDGKLVGIVSRRDIVELILEAKKDISPFRYV